MQQLSPQQEEDFENAVFCHICERIFQESDIRIKDHSHFTGVYRGSVHRNCNIIYRVTHAVPVFFYNPSGYDGYFLIKTSN